MYLIGITGGSGSGKTTFAKKILAQTQETDLLTQDSYYHSRSPEHLSRGGSSNFDHPDAFDWDLLRGHLAELRAGREVLVPAYDYHSSSRAFEARLLRPPKVLIFEGIFALWDFQIRKMLDLKIFLDVDADIRLIRRLHRDIQERGRTIDEIIGQYYDTVRPMHREYLEPTRQFADLVVGEENETAANVVAAKVRQILGTI